MPSRYYYLGPWVAAEGGWEPPPGTVGLIDLRSLAMGATFGFFATDTPLAGDYTALGDDLYGGAPAGARGLWNGALGVNVEGNSILDLLTNTLILAADPDGDTLCPPLMPTHRGQMEIHLGGHSLVRSWRFAGESDPAWPKVQAVVQRNVRAVRGKGASAGRAALAGKYAESMRLKLRVAPERLIPADVRDVRALRPTTTLTDDFNRADSSTLGGSWTEVSGDYQIVSNQIAPAATGSDGNSNCRWEADLSSDDHIAEINAAAWSGSLAYVAGCARFAADAQTFYYGIIRSGNWIIRKRVTGNNTNLSSVTSLSSSPPFKSTTKADGSTISLLKDDGEIGSLTDTSITGNLRGGLVMRASNLADGERGDNWLAADLVGGPTFQAAWARNSNVLVMA